ncbi:MAG: hypothetical protein HZB29_09365 [Nitrospinae bacterium]|nr:hypothetical protein [Nitrospinota bacterium]
MPVELTGKTQPGFNTNSTTERVYQSMKVSRATELAKSSGPVGGASMPGSGAVIVKQGVRGILNQMNVGDVGSAVDSVVNAVNKAGQQLREDTRQQAKKTEQATSEIGSKVKTQLSSTGGKVELNA